MKAKKFSLILAALVVMVCFLINLSLLFVVPGRAEATVSTLSERAVQFLYQEYTENGIINSDVGVGSYALYVLNQAGVDISTWSHNGISLKDAVITTVRDDISNADKVSAKRLAHDLAAMKALGQTSLADQLILILKNKQGSKGFEDTGPLSIYSNVPAFELLSRIGLINQINTGQAKDYILDKQYTGGNDALCGSWGSSEDDRYYADFMVTTGAIRVLHRLDPAKSDVRIQKAINDGLVWVKNQQKAGGNFMAGMDDTLVDTCEVVVTLKTLGMDPEAWKSSEGKSAVDYIMNKALNPDGSFGMSQNAMDAIWALCAYNILGIYPGDEGKETEKTVGLAVVGMSGELLYGPSDVTVAETNKYGLTVLGALDASGISYHASSWSYGIYVDSIGEQANSGMSGWMYVVNGQTPSVGADQYDINNNDKIIFYYSTSMDQQPPQWDELVPEDIQFYLDPAGVILNVGDKHQLRAVWEDASGTTDVTQHAQWSVADDSIADVDSAGLVTALKAGQTEVNAVYGGLTASAVLTVSSSGGGGGGGGGSAGKSISVGLAVVGLNDEILLGPINVTVDETNEWGLTALGALDASGISYNASKWSYGYLVDYIDGLANSGLSGWMYVVNDQVPGEGADKRNIKKNDKIIFYFSTSMEQAPPKWDELKKQVSEGGGSGISTKLPDPVNDTVLNNAVRKAGEAGMVALEADSTETMLALSSIQLDKILDKGKPLAATVQGVQFVFSIDTLIVPELIVDNTAQLQIQARKLSSKDAESIVLPLTAELILAGDVYELNVLAVSKDGKEKNIRKLPDCKVLLPVPGDLQEVAAVGKIMACRYNESSQVWEEAGGTYDITSGTVSFGVEHFSKYALFETISPPEAPAKKTFEDIASHWAREEIELMATMEYLAGVGNNEFAPENTVTRAEFVTIIARMAGLTANPGGAACFYDVPVDAWYCGTLGAAVTAGLVYGVDENSFAPHEPVTREQIATMMVRLMAKDGPDITISAADTARLLAGFSDGASVSSWACAPVALMAKEKVMTGRENGQFVPLGHTTRAEAAVALCRMAQKTLLLEQ